MSKLNTSAENLIGERLCLDFANTVSWHNSDNPKEWLINYEKIVEWSRYADILSSPQQKSLLEKAKHHPDQAAKVLEEAIELREAIFRLFRSIAAGLEPDSFDRAILNKYLTRAYSLAEIIPKESTYTLSFQKGEHELDYMLWPIMQSAIDLLLSEKLDRVKQCEGEPCGWLFFDSSRNKSRRWCSMADCGNREKARRYYKKKSNLK
ncbi:ABATE domain-containing protein [Oceanobacillus sojae]|uniref:CGNR zinc finger domain-containing protein n=1 Tax=Oceanobacillus sojae TaxID=582851 RepID=UPI0021A8DB9B|nr:ABATE domain-containing protein [Oceanobacillus sojae]MCT1902874.1 CGNR zinc finger domain-containing protein [Oceanobacillus sojae]